MEREKNTRDDSASTRKPYLGEGVRAGVVHQQRDRLHQILQIRHTKPAMESCNLREYFESPSFFVILILLVHVAVSALKGVFRSTRDVRSASFVAGRVRATKPR